MNIPIEHKSEFWIVIVVIIAFWGLVVLNKPTDQFTEWIVPLAASYVFGRSAVKTVLASKTTSQMPCAPGGNGNGQTVPTP